MFRKLLIAVLAAGFMAALAGGGKALRLHLELGDGDGMRLLSKPLAHVTADQASQR